MTLYLVERTDKIGFDESYACVVVCGNGTDAIRLAKTLRGDQPAEVWDRAQVTYLARSDENHERIVLVSFNAG